MCWRDFLFDSATEAQRDPHGCDQMGKDTCWADNRGEQCQPRSGCWFYRCPQGKCEVTVAYTKILKCYQGHTCITIGSSDRRLGEDIVWIWKVVSGKIPGCQNCQYLGKSAEESCTHGPKQAPERGYLCCPFVFWPFCFILAFLVVLGFCFCFFCLSV